MLEERDDGLPSLALATKTTFGEGDCAFHALLGVLLNGVYRCPNVQKQRNDVYLAMIADSVTETLKSAIIAGICSLVMDGHQALIAQVGKHTHQLYKDYIAFSTHSDGDSQIQVAWQSFHGILSRHAEIIDMINERSPLGEKPTVNNFKEQFYDVLSQNDDKLKQEIDAIPELSEAYKVYQRSYQHEFPWETRAVACIGEYANYIKKPGNWLLPSDLAILAIVFNKRIIYYATRLSTRELINPTGAEEVIICFNGADHYERAVHYDAPILSASSSSTAEQKSQLTGASASPDIGAPVVILPLASQATSELGDLSSKTASFVPVESEISASEILSTPIALTNPLHEKLRRGMWTLLRRFNAEHELFEGELLQCYVPLGGYIPHLNQHVDDISASAHQWIKDTYGKGNESSLVLTGLSGSGKTLWGQQLVWSLWCSEFANNAIPLWVPLLSMKVPSQSLLRSYLKLLNNELVFEEEKLTDAEIAIIMETPLLLVLDGYDELNTSINLYTTNSFDATPKIQVIFTCRTEAKPDYLNRFGANHSAFTIIEYQLKGFCHDRDQSQIRKYIQKFVSYRMMSEVVADVDSPIAIVPQGWSLEVYMKHIEQMPDLDELINNPFILAMVVRELPTIVAENSSNMTNAHVILLTRYKIYQAFLERWFKRRADKLLKLSDSTTHQIIESLTEKNQGRGLAEILRGYSHGVAIDMFKHHTGNIYLPLPSASSIAEFPPIWQSKWLDRLDSTNIEDKQLRLLRQNSLLMPLGSHRYSFLHKSLMEFFAAQHLFNGALVDGWIRAGRNLNVRGLLEQAEEFNFLVDQVKCQQDFEHALWQIIDMSRSEPSVWRAAANAISLLNAAGISFSGKNLSRIRIGGDEGWGANLSHAVLDGTNLSYADLRWVNFSGAYLVNANLAWTCLDGAVWGEMSVYDLSDNMIEPVHTVSKSMRWLVIKASSIRYFIDECIQYHIYEFDGGCITKKCTINRTIIEEPIAIDEKNNIIVFARPGHLTVCNIYNGAILYKIPEIISRWTSVTIVIPISGEYRSLLFINNFLVYIAHKQFNKNYKEGSRVIFLKVDDIKYAYLFSIFIENLMSGLCITHDEKLLFYFNKTDGLSVNSSILYINFNSNEIKSTNFTLANLSDVFLVSDTAISDDDNLLAVAIKDNHDELAVFIYDISVLSEANRLTDIQLMPTRLYCPNVPSKSIKNIKFSFNSQLLTASLGSKIILWQLSNHGSYRIFCNHANDIKHLTFNESGNSILSISDEPIIQVWSFNNQNQRGISPKRESTSYITHLDLTDDGTRLILLDSQRILTLFDTGTYQKLKCFSIAAIDVIYLNFTRLGDLSIVIMDKNKSIYSFNNELNLIDDRFNKDNKEIAHDKNHEFYAKLQFLFYIFTLKKFKINYLKKFFDNKYICIDVIHISSGKIIMFFEKEELRKYKEIGSINKELWDNGYVVEIINFNFDDEFKTNPLITRELHRIKAYYETVSVMIGSKKSTTPGPGGGDEVITIIYGDRYFYKECRMNVSEDSHCIALTATPLSNKNRIIQESRIFGNHGDKKCPRVHFLSTNQLYIPKTKPFYLEPDGKVLNFSISSRFLVITIKNAKSLKNDLFLWDRLKSMKIILSGFYYDETTKATWLPNIHWHKNHEVWHLITFNQHQGVWVWKIKNKDNSVTPRLSHVMNGTTKLDTRGLKIKRASGLVSQVYQLLVQQSEKTCQGRPETRPSEELIQARNAQIYIPEGEILYKDVEGNIFRITDKEWLIQWVRYRDNSNNKHVWLIIQGLDDRNYTVVHEVHFYLNVHKPHFFALAGKGYHVVQDKSPRDIEAYGNDQLASISWRISSNKIKAWLDGLMASQERAYTLEGRIGYNCVSWCREQLAILGLPLTTEEYPSMVSRIAAIPQHYIPVTEEGDEEESKSCRLM